MKTKMLLIVMISLLVGCAPTIKKIAQEDIDDFNYYRGVNDGIDIGYRMAIDVARKEYEDRLYSITGKFKDHLMYLQLVKGGVLEPARVVTEMVGGQISEDGKTYESPYLRWSIIKDPAFNLDKSLRWRQKDDENYCYLLLSIYDDYKKALKELGKIQRPSGGYVVLFDVVRQVNPKSESKDDSSRYALIVKTPKSYCGYVKDFYSLRGFDVMQEIGSPAPPTTK